jgi:hypothetical protein
MKETSMIWCVGTCSIVGHGFVGGDVSSLFLTNHLLQERLACCLDVLCFTLDVESSLLILLRSDLGVD